VFNRLPHKFAQYFHVYIFQPVDVQTRLAGLEFAQFAQQIVAVVKAGHAIEAKVLFVPRGDGLRSIIARPNQDQTGM